MARDEDFKERRRREEKEERDRAELEGTPQPARAVPGKPQADAPPPTGDTQTLFQQIEPMLEQLNNLYQMYANGVEKRPPTERRQLLETLITRVQESARATPALRFRLSTILASYQSHKDRWEKLLKAVEQGKARK